MGRKHLAVNRQHTSLRATKVLSTAKTNGYKKIEEHECKPNTSEKQSVEMSASRSKIRLEEAEEEQDVGSWTVSEFTNLLFASSPMSAGAGLLAAGLNRFLVFGIVISLAIIKDVFIAACNLNYL